jgi:HEPN domain-containing protein
LAKEHLKQYEILFKKARVDLHSAKILLELFGNGDKELELEIVYFHMQQCAEKFIKTLLDFNKVKFPHTHDLEDLIYLLQTNKIDSIDKIESLIPLSEYAVEGRYAVIHDDLDDTDAYLKLLNELLVFVKKEVGL